MAAARAGGLRRALAGLRVSEIARRGPRLGRARNNSAGGSRRKAWRGLSGRLLRGPGVLSHLALLAAPDSSSATLRSSGGWPCLSFCRFILHCGFGSRGVCFRAIRKCRARMARVARAVCRDDLGTALRWCLLVAAALVAWEMLQARLFSGFPWNLLGASQYHLLPLIQIASVTGCTACHSSSRGSRRRCSARLCDCREKPAGASGAPNYSCRRSLLPSWWRLAFEK